jgi:hypothetical protein
MSKVREVKTMYFDNFEESNNTMNNYIKDGWTILGYGTEAYENWFFTASLKSVEQPRKQFSMKYREDLAVE